MSKNEEKKMLINEVTINDVKAQFNGFYIHFSKTHDFYKFIKCTFHALPGVQKLATFQNNLILRPKSALKFHVPICPMFSLTSPQLQWTIKN